MEIGLAIALFILFIGILNTITISNKVLILSHESLLNNSKITIEFVTPNGSMFATYRLSDISILHDDYLYIQFPIEGKVRVISIYPIIEVKELLDKGINKVLVEVYPINISSVKFGNFHSGGLALSVNKWGAHPWVTYIWGDYTNVPIIQLTNPTPVKANYSEKYKVTFGRFEKNVTVSELLMRSISANALDKKLGLTFALGDASNLDGIKLKLQIYAFETKPVLQVLTEPVYGFIAGLWSSLLALYYRLRQYVLSFFGGFTGVTIFTGLIGDVIVGLIITTIVITIFYIALGRPSPRGRR